MLLFKSTLTLADGVLAWRWSAGNWKQLSLPAWLVTSNEALTFRKVEQLLKPVKPFFLLVLWSANEQRNPRTWKYKSAFWSLQRGAVSILNFLFSFCAFFSCSLNLFSLPVIKKSICYLGLYEFTSILMFTALLSSLTLPLIFIFLWSKTAYLLSALKQD